MGAPKGHKRYGGREKGVPNKTTTETKEMIKNFMQDKFEEVSNAWDGLSPVDKVKTYIQLVPYIMPRLNSISVIDENGDDVIKQILDSQK